jgi:hypothetical protein
LSDSRGRAYAERFGRESWELDALEPSVLATLVREAIADRRDDEIWATSIARRDRARTVLTDLAARVDDEINDME